uniref:Uncharacterized protein n=1 Tax=Arundo donax TaxID=35708 RepID=A0A0A9E7M8_ARUDO
MIVIMPNKKKTIGDREKEMIDRDPSMTTH